MVSVVITTYKREPRMVLRALDSALAQTYRDLEIIIVDDSPSDFPAREDVHAVVEMRQHENPEINIRYIAHTENKGACIARNTGLEVAAGEFIAYLDDDDEWLPEKIEKQMQVVQKSNAGLVYCGNLVINDMTGVRTPAKKEFYRGNVFKRLLNNNFIASTSYPLIRTKCLKEVGGFDPLMQAAQDYDVWLRLAERFEIDYVDEPLVLYHEHEGERITTNPKKKINGPELINQKYAKYLEADRKLWWKRNLSVAYYYAMAHEKKKAFSLWFMCVRKCPEKVLENCISVLRIMQVMTFNQATGKQ